MFRGNALHPPRHQHSRPTPSHTHTHPRLPGFQIPSGLTCKSHAACTMRVRPKKNAHADATCCVRERASEWTQTCADGRTGRPGSRVPHGLTETRRVQLPPISCVTAPGVAGVGWACRCGVSSYYARGRGRQWIWKEWKRKILRHEVEMPATPRREVYVPASGITASRAHDTHCTGQCSRFDSLEAGVRHCVRVLSACATVKMWTRLHEAFSCVGLRLCQSDPAA
jgi:hypothetical protein